MNKIDKAKKILKEYKEADEVGVKVYWVKASCFYTWRKEGLFAYLFDGAGTWGEFLSVLGVPMSSAQQKIKNWEFFIVKHGFKVEEVSDVDSSCLYYIAQNVVGNKTGVKEWIKQAREMPRDEFLALIKGVEPCSHEHTEVVNEAAERCRDCNKKIKQPV